MPKVGRNDPCPCGSGKKHKKCCLQLRQAAETPHEAKPQRLSREAVQAFEAEVDAMNDLSNSVLDLIRDGKLDEAEDVCHQLLELYPTQVDGLERLAMVYEARGQDEKAAGYYRKVARFIESKPGFGKEYMEWATAQAVRLESRSR